MCKVETSDKLRIMMICGFPTNPYVGYVVRALIGKKIKIALVTRKSLNLTIENGSCSVYKIFPRIGEGNFFSSAFSEMIGFVRLLHLFFQEKPHIIHFQCYRIMRFKLGWLFFLILKILKKKIVFTTHEMSTRDGIIINDFIMEKAAKYCDGFFAHANYTKEKMCEKWKLQEDKIAIVPHGGYYLNCAEFIPMEYARKRLGYEPYDYILLFFGLVAKYKGLDYLLPAVAQAKKVLPNLKLIIAGRADNKFIGDHFRKLISELDLEHEVDYKNRFIRNREVAGLFCCCDIVVLPYIEINQSGVLCMSYTFGKAVIATRIGGIPEMVQDNITGYIVPPADIDALTEKIIEGWHQREKLREMGLNAQNLINTEYSWDRLADSTIEIYKKILRISDGSNSKRT